MGSAGYTVPLRLEIRACVENDLVGLEWFGMFTEHREIIRGAFERQASGEVDMLVAVVNGFPVGQIWIDYHAGRLDGAALLWAVRVLPPLQDAGIGRRLIEAAEGAILLRGVQEVEVDVERDNVRALAFYERQGFLLTGGRSDGYTYTSPAGQIVTVPLDLLSLRKNLSS